MSDLDYIWKEAAAFRIGLAPHYPLLYSAVVGLEANTVCEFGAGVSTRVILDALTVTGGHHWSVSTESREDVATRANILDNDFRWTHFQGLSEEWPPRLDESLRFDLVLHDGSHSADVVATDLTAILPRIRQHGLLLVHDSLHSYVGADVRKGLGTVLAAWGEQFELVTLPWAFGLTVVRVLGNQANGPVTIARQKAGSPHRTVVGPPCAEWSMLW